MMLLVAVLMAITAVTVAVAPQRPVRDGSATTTTAPGEPAPPPTASPRARDDDQPSDAPLATMDAWRRGQLVRVPAGARVRLRVMSRGLETVQLGTDGPIEVVDGDSPAEFDVLAEDGLDARVRLLESGRTIGRLVAQ